MGDFENLDFEIARGPWQILTRNFKKQEAIIVDK